MFIFDAKTPMKGDARMDDLVADINRLEEILKIYLMAVGGVTTRLGGVACSLLETLIDTCKGDFEEAQKRINLISVAIIATIYTSVLERLDDLGDSAAATHKSALSRVGQEIELLPHLLFLKSITIDLGICTKSDYTPMTQKIQELINGLRS